MAIKRIERYGRIYTYDGTKLIGVSKDRKIKSQASEPSIREKTAEKNKGKVYEAGKGLTDRGGTSKKYNLGMSDYAKAKRAQETAAKQLDNLYEERYKIQQLDSKNTDAIKNIDSRIKQAESKLNTAASDFEAAKTKRYFDRQTVKFDNETKKPGFVENSKYKGDVTSDNLFTKNEATQIYAYINDPEIQKIMDTAAFSGSNGSQASAYPTLKYMDEKQIATYNSLYNTRNDGGKAAKSYIDDYLSYALNEAYYTDAEAEAKKFAEENPVGASAVSVPKNVFGGLGAIDAYGQKIGNAISGNEDKPIDWNRPIMANTSGSATTIRETVAESIDNPALKFFYQTGMSMADSAASMPMGAWAGPAFLGMSAGTATMREAKSNGATDDQALAMGGAAAVFEFACEKIGMDNLFNAKNAAQVEGWVKTILKQANVEGSEEVLTSLSNTVADAVIMGDKSEYNRTVQSYMQQGYSKADAEKMATQDWAQNLAMDYVGGAFSGGVFGGSSMGVQAAANRISTPTVDKYANKKDIDNALGVETQTSLPTIEAFAGVDVAREVEQTMRAANPELQTTARFALDNSIEISNAAEKYYGTTNNIADAGYITLSGNMLDFSEGQAYGRTLDHRDVRNVYDENNVEGDFITFLDEGNIRIMPESGGIDLTQAPNKAQKEALTSFIDAFDGEVAVDLELQYQQNKAPKTIIYEAGTPAAKILADIDNYYRYGTLPKMIDGIRFAMADENGGIADENILDGSSRRDIGERTGEQTLRVGETAGEVENRIREIERIEESGNASEVVDDSGSVEVRYNEIPESMLPAYCLEIKEMLSEYGINTRFSLGQIQMIDEDGRSHAANGFMEGNTVVLNASAENLNKNALHELFHYLKASNTEAYNDFRDAVKNNAFGEGQFAAYANRIRQLYKGISNSTNDIIEEVMANVYAGIYSVENTAALSEAIDAFNEQANNTGKNKSIVKFNKSEKSKLTFKAKNSTPWPKDFPDVDVAVLWNDEYKNNPDRLAGKKGDISAAIRLANKYVTQEFADKIKKEYGDSILVPVSDYTATDKNALPMGFASILAYKADMPLDTSIEKINKTSHASAKNALQRISERAIFKGEVKQNNYYLLLDDFVALGSTVADLRNYIEANGGNVVGAAAIGASNESSLKLAPKEETIARLENIGREEIENVLREEGIAASLEDLTEAEARNIARSAEKALRSDGLRGLAYRIRAAKLKGNESADNQINRRTNSVINEEETTKDGGFSIAENSQEKLDAQYKQAVESGDMETAQRMVDEAAQKAGYTQKAMHGTPDARIVDKYGQAQDSTSFTVFDANKSYADKIDGTAFYFTNNENVAQFYAPKVSEFSFDQKAQPKIYNTYLSLGKTLKIDCNGAAWNEITIPSDVPKRTFTDRYTNTTYVRDKADTAYFTKWAKENGYDSVTFENIIDGNAADLNMMGTVYAVFSSEQIKSADAVTYDDEGNIIPLSQRFEPKKKDIRFSISEEAPKKKRSSKSKADLESLYATEPEKVRSSAPKPNRSKEYFDSLAATEPPKKSYEKAKEHAKKYDGTEEYSKYKEERLDMADEILEKGYYNNITFSGQGNTKYDLSLVWNKYLPRSAYQIRKYNKQHYGVDTRFILDTSTVTENGITRKVDGLLNNGTVYLNLNADNMLAQNSKEVFKYIAEKYPYEYNRLYDSVLGFMSDSDYARLASLHQNKKYASYEDKDFEILSDLFSDPQMIGDMQLDNEKFISKELEAFKKTVEQKTGVALGKNQNPSRSKEYKDSLYEMVDEQADAEAEKAYFLEDYVSPEDKAKEAFEAEIAKVDLPKKAQKFFDKKVNEYAKLAFDLMSTLKEDKAGMKADIRIFAEEILRTGKINNARLSEIAQRLWQGGVVIDKSFMDQHKDLYDRLKDIKINVPQRVRNDIADYNDYRKSILGLVKTGKDGRQIDDLYQELNSMDSSLFPDDIINATDQFLRIVSVREMFKPVATKNAKVTEMGYKDYAIKEFARLTQEFYGNVMQAHEYRKIVLEGSEDIGYVDQKRNQEAAKHLGESLKAFAAWKKENLIDKYSEEQARKIVYEDLAVGSFADQTLSGKKINKNLVEKAIPYLRNIKKYEDVTAAYKRQQKARAYAKAKMVTAYSDLWIDKKNGLQYMRETQERNIEDIAGKTDPEGAAMIKEMYLDPVHANEAQKQEFMNMLQEKIGALDLTGAERLLTQAYGEGLITITDVEDFANTKGKIVIQTEKGEIVYEQGFIGKARNVDVAKVENAVSEFREVYDMLIDRANEVLVANGYARIEKLADYFPHFSSDQGIFDTIKTMFFGTDMNIDAALPEDINGLTHVFRPGKKFFANFLHRKGSATGLDAYMGFDMYLAGIADVIFHTEDIQNWRALEVVLRNKHTNEETQKRIKDIWNSDLPYNERESQIAGILDAAQTGNLSNYVVNLSEYIGVLAGKKSIFDRPSERAFNRRIYATMQAVEGRVASNMLGGNVGSWLTNFIPLVQMNAQVKSKYMLKAVKQTMQSWKNNDGFVNGSDFLTNRRGNNPLSKDVFHKMSDAAMKPMEYIDMFTTEVCCRAVYLEQIAKGKTHEEAMREANDRTARVVADRSYGALPTIFNVRNPLAKLFTQFQVEVNNQFSNLFKDIPRRVKEEGMGFLIWALIKYFIGAALFNDLYEKLAGRRPAFDPIGMIKEAYKTYEKTEDAGAVAKNVVSNAVEQVPFIGTFLGGGRVPVSSAIPFSGDLDSLTTAITNLASPEVAWEEKKEILNKEVSKPVFYLFFPTAGGAVKKVIEGSKIVAEGGAYTYNKEGEKTVKYAVDQEAGDYLQNMIFGAWSSPEAQNYLLSGSKALGVKETQTFDALKGLGMKPTEAFDVVKEISDIQGIPNVTGSKAKNRMEAIDDLEVSEDVKYQLYYDMVIPDSKKEDFDMGLNEFGMSKSDLMTAYRSTYGIKGDKDSEGKTVSGSKSEKVKAQLDSIDGLNAQQQEFMYDTFDVGKNARGINAAEKAQMLENSVISAAANYDIPNYSAKTKQKINDIGVSINDYAYLSDRISAYDDKINYLKSFNFNDDQLRGLVSEMVMGDTAQDKMLVAGEEYGIPEDIYIDAYIFGYESTGTKTERNEKIYNYIQGLQLKDEQKAALYDYIKVYKRKDAADTDTGGKTSKSSSGGGRSFGRKKISVPSAPTVAIKKVSGAGQSNIAAMFKNIAERQKRADYEAQLESINNNIFMTAAQKASAKRRLQRQFNM